MRQRDLNDLVWGALLTSLALALVSLPPPHPTHAWLYAIIFAPLPGLFLVGRYFVGRHVPKGLSWHPRTPSPSSET